MTDITTALETVRTVAKWYDAHGPVSYAALAALSTIETELTRLRESADYWERNFRKMTDQAVAYKDDRDEAVAALRATPHVGGRPGETHRSHPNVMSCHACAVLARLSTPKEPGSP